MKYKVGDRVRIISHEKMRYANGRNSNGLMDHWGGKVVTICATKVGGAYGGYYKIEEDHHEWFWYEHMIECLDEAIIEISEDNLMSFLGQ